MAGQVNVTLDVAWLMAKLPVLLLPPKTLGTCVLTSKEIHRAVLQSAAASLSVRLSFRGRNLKRGYLPDCSSLLRTKNGRIHRGDLMTDKRVPAWGIQVMESKGKASVRLTGDPIHEIKLIAYELLRVTRNLPWMSEKSRAILA